MLTALAIVGGLAAAHTVKDLVEDHHYRDYHHDMQMYQLQQAIQKQHDNELKAQLEAVAAQQQMQQAQQTQSQQITDLQQTVDSTNSAVQQLCGAVAQLTQSVHDGQIATAKRFCDLESQMETLRKEQEYIKKQLRKQKGGGNNHNP